MKTNTPISLPAAELKPALAGLAKVIGRRHTLPVLEMVRVERADGGWVTLTGTDLDTFATVRLEQPAEGAPCAVLVSHGDLARIAKDCGKEETLTVEKAEGDRALVRFLIGGQPAEEHLLSLPVEEYPSTPQVKGDPVPLGHEVRAAIRQAMQCASDDETRQILQGAFIDVSDKKCHHVVGTNGRHLYTSNSFALALGDSLVIPNHRFLGWKEFNNDGEWRLRSQPEKADKKGKVEEHAMLEISSRRWRFVTRAIEGNYPNWRQCVPRASEATTVVELGEEQMEPLLQMLKRLPVPAKDVNQTIGLRVEKNAVHLRARSSVEGKWTEVEAGVEKVTGGPLLVHLNRDYMAKALGFGLTRIELRDEKWPLRFVNGGRQMVVMPVRVVAAVPEPAPGTPEESNGGETQQPTPAPAAEAGPTERSTMPRNSTTTNGAATNGANGTNGHRASGTPEKASIESALEKIDAVKGSCREAIQGLNDLADTLKQAQRDQRTASKEVQTVRATLEKLQSVKL